MIDINEYMQKDKAERCSHLKLSDACIERGGHRNNYRGVLAHFLNTTFPNDRKVNLCHACNNGKCSNVYHLYWGWAKENTQDQIENGTLQSISARTKAKMGSKYEKFMSDIGRKGGKAQRKKTGTENWDYSSGVEQSLDKR